MVSAVRAERKGERGGPSSAPLSLSGAAAKRWLLPLAALVLAAGLSAELIRAWRGLDGESGLVPLFSLSYEQNVPTCFTAALLFSAGLLLALRASAARVAGEPRVLAWRGLAAGFFYIATDEIVQLHEAAGFLRLGGLLYFSWVVPAAVLVALLGLLYLPFLAGLPKRTRRRFVVAGAVYVAGAVLVELPLGAWTERHGTDNLGYGLIDWVEESMEIGGLVLFLLALVDHLGETGHALRFVAPAEEASS